MNADFEHMPIHQLKVYLKEHGVDDSTAIEKGDLVDLARTSAGRQD